MRRRLVISFVGLVAGVLALTGLGTFVLTARATAASEQHDLRTEAEALAHQSDLVTHPTVLATLKSIGRIEGATIPILTPDGGFLGNLPAHLAVTDLDVASLEAGHATSGHKARLVFAAVPVTLPAAPGYHYVVVLTRNAPPPPGAGYVFLVAAAALVASVLLATWIAGRFTRPLAAALSATRGIAEGDLDSRVDVGPHDDPEIQTLATSINTMAANLAAARVAEREFLLSISHELRTPLTSILGYAEAVADGTADDVARAVKVIGAEGRRLNRLVDDLLSLARLDARSFSFAIGPVDARSAVADAATGMRPAIEGAGLSLAITGTDGPPLLARADADRLRQVITNLVENAYKFARTSIAIDVSSPPGTAGARITITDDGPGIAQPAIEKVFDRRYSDDRAVARKAGSGLGLAIVAELVSAMGGTVRAVSPVTEAGGTSMVVDLAGAPSARDA